MGSAIEDKVSNCATRQGARNKQPKEPLLPHNRPARPWSKVATDLFKWYRHDYVLVVDYYSNYIETAKLENTLSITAIAHVKSNISRYDIVGVLISDNGPQLRSQEFKEFARQYEFEHKTSSLTYAQNNELAERAVQTMKIVLTKAKQS